MKLLPLLLTLATTLTSNAQVCNSTTPHLNLTAITAHNGLSALQCWQLSTPIASSGTSGLTGALTLPLTNASSATWVVQEPHTVGGMRNAAAPTLTWVISGLLHVTLLNSSDEAVFIGGRYGLLFADDAGTPGHVAHFEGPDQTVMLLTTLPKGTTPAHRVLHEGACRVGELVGL